MIFVQKPHIRNLISHVAVKFKMVTLIYVPFAKFLCTSFSICFTFPGELGLKCGRFTISVTAVNSNPLARPLAVRYKGTEEDKEFSSSRLNSGFVV